MKKKILIGAVTLAILGLFTLSRNKTIKKKVFGAAAKGLLSNTALKMLHRAKRAAIKEIHVKC